MRFKTKRIFFEKLKKDAHNHYNTADSDISSPSRCDANQLSQDENAAPEKN